MYKYLMHVCINRPGFCINPASARARERANALEPGIAPRFQRKVCVCHNGDVFGQIVWLHGELNDMNWVYELV